MKYIKTYKIFESEESNAERYVVVTYDYMLNESEYSEDEDDDDDDYENTESEDEDMESNPYCSFIIDLQKFGSYLAIPGIGEGDSSCYSYADAFYDVLDEELGDPPYKLEDILNSGVEEKLKSRWDEDTRGVSYLSIEMKYLKDSLPQEYIDRGLLDLLEIMGSFQFFALKKNIHVNIYESIASGNNFREALVRLQPYIIEEINSYLDKIKNPPKEDDVKIIIELSELLMNNSDLIIKIAEVIVPILLHDTKFLLKVYKSLPDLIKDRIKSEGSVDSDSMKKLKDLEDLGFF